MIRRSGLCCLLIVLVACTSSNPSTNPTRGAGRWEPPLNSRWQYQLQGRERYVSTGGVNVNICAVPFTDGPCVTPTVFDIDLYAIADVPTLNSAAVDAIHAAGGHAICYVDAGSIETYRPDYSNFAAFDDACDGCLIGDPFSKIFNDENW